MATRGPKPGWKLAQNQSPPDEVHDLPTHHRENPEMLSGEALRVLAHKRGLARSDIDTMDDDKIRMQLRYLTHRQYDDAVA